MFCDKCAHRQSVSDKFCAHCGVSFVVGGEEVTVTKLSSNSSEQYNKIGGWLWLIAIVVFLDPIFSSYNVFDSLSFILNGSALVPGLVNFMWFEIVFSTIYFFGAIYLVFSFYKKKRNFPKYFIWLILISIFYLIVRYVLLASLNTPFDEGKEILTTMLNDQLSALIIGTIINIILIVYIKVSKRAKGTFVN